MPQIIVSLRTMHPALVDFAISSVLQFVLMFIYGASPAATVVWLPLFVFPMLITALGVGFWLTALNVEYRDIIYTVPFLNQFCAFNHVKCYRKRAY